MRKYSFLLILSLVLLASALAPAAARAQADPSAVVRAVLFYSPTCGHCQYVITEVLRPMVQEYGDQLAIIGIDVTQPGGGQLFGQALDYFQLPPERGVVPTLIIENTVLQGSGEIPDQFPGLVAAALETGGTDWPAFPGLAAAIPPEAGAGAGEDPSVSPTPEAAQAPSDGGLADLEEVADEAPPDPVGFTLGALVLAGLAGSLGATGSWLSRARPRLPHWRLPPEVLTGYAQNGWIFLLGLAGLGVAGYLAYVEVSQLEAVCGPVGACNLVQGSAYARFLGVPVAALGLAFFLSTVVLWFALRMSSLSLEVRQYAGLAMIGLAAGGTLFSIYLTGMELFVIHAICLWCLSSAILTGSLLVVLGWPLRKP